MPEGQPLVIGIGLLIFGLVFILGVWFVLRIAPRVRPAQLQPVQPSLIQIQEHLDAVLIVQSGGRITHINGLARNLFDISENDSPSLERIGRRVRPGEVFLELCAAQGQARFSINGQLVDAVSYPLPGQIPSILVAIRRAQNSLAAVGQHGLSEAALKTIADFGKVVTANLSLEATLQSVLTHIEKLVATDFLEVKIWDSAQNRFDIYKLGPVVGALRQVIKSQDTQFGDYANHIFAQKQELVFENTRTELPVRFSADNIFVPPMGSYIGLPLEVGGQFAGVLEVGIIQVGSFSQEDVSLLRMVSDQAAVAIRNAILYETQEKWNAQLLGLTNLAQKVGSLHDMRDLFSNLVDGLAPLFPVNILGFLIYDEQRRLLEAQHPFFGLSQQFVDIYKAPIRAGSDSEKILAKPEIISTADASSDEMWANLGLRDMAQAASMRGTNLVPLVSTGRFLGYLQISNYKQGYSHLSSDELRLLNLVANQVASIVDNALLVQQARLRNRRSEAMRRIASLVSSSATFDELLKFSIQEAAQMIGADMATVFLLDEKDGSMRAHIDSVYGLGVDEITPLANFQVRPSLFHQTIAGSQRAFLSGALSTDRRVLSFYRAFISHLQIESCVVIPLIVRGQGIGELMIGSRGLEAFNNYDLQVATIVGNQLTVAIENARYAKISERGVASTDENVWHVSRIAREFNTTNDLRELLRMVYDESLKITNANHAAVLFFEKGTAQGLSYPDSVLMNLGKAKLADSLWMNSEAALPKDILLINSFTEDTPAPAVDIHTVAFSPLNYQDKIFGLIELHFKENNLPGQSVRDMLQILSHQAAIALSNTFLYRQQTQQIDSLATRTKTLDVLVETADKLGDGKTLLEDLTLMAQSIQKTTPFDVVLISIYDAKTDLLSRACAIGIPDETFSVLQAHQQSWASVAQLLKPEFLRGSLYYIPHDRTPIVSQDVQVVTLAGVAGEGPDSWHAEDLLLVPIFSDGNVPLGLVSVDSPRNGKTPTQDIFETLEILASQLKFILYNARRFSDMETETKNLSHEILRQKKLLGFGQRNLPILLNKDLEQTISINYLNQRALHVRGGLNLTEAVSRQLDFDAALLVLGEKILFSFEMSISLVAKDSPEGPRIVHMLGNLPRGVNPDAMFGQRNPLRYCIQTGETIVSANIDEDETWHDTPFLSALKAKSFICMPIVAAEKASAAILAIGLEPMPTLQSNDKQVYAQIARQLSVTIQNIGLLGETRRRLGEVNLLLDFSRRLSGLTPDEILQALLDSALRVVANAHAGVVLLWDEGRQLLIPQSTANYADIESMMQLNYQMGEGLPGRIFASRHSQIIDEVNFASDYNLSADSLLLYRKATGGRLPVSSIAVPIRVNQRDVGILVLDNFNTSAAFSQQDEAILSSLTQQVALSLENVRLVQSTQERALQLQALNSVASALSSSLNREELVASLLDRIGTIIAYDTAILWIREDKYLIVAQANGFDDAENRKGLSVMVEDSLLLKQMIESGRAIYVGDVRSDARFPSLVEAKNLSWLGIPIMVKGNVIGVIVLEKTESHYYTNEQIQLAATFASQAAVALENANLFEESQRRTAQLDERSKRLTLLNQFSADLSGSLSTDQVLRLTANQLMLAVKADKAMLLMFEGSKKSFLMTVLPDEEAHAPMYRALPASVALSELLEIQTVYVADRIDAHAELESLSELFGDAHSLLLLPIFTARRHYAVMVLIDQPHLFSSTEIELARTLSNQAVIALENADLYQSTVETAERLSILNQVSFEIGSSLDPEEIYRTVHNAVSKLMPIDAFVIAMHDETSNEIEGVYIMDMGQRITGVRLPFGQGLSGKVIASGKPIMTISGADDEAKDAVIVGENEQGAPNSILAVPMIQSDKVIGMISCQSYQHNAYSQDDMELLSTLVNQVTVAIQNGRLFDQTQKMTATLEQRVIDRTAELEREQRNTETLLRILTEVSASLDLDRALGRTLALLNDAIGAEQGTIMLVHPEDNMLHYRAGYGYVSENSEEDEETKARQSAFKLRIGEGLAGWVVKNRQSVLVEDLYTDPRWVVSKSSQNHRSAIVAPLTVGEDVIGSIMVFHRRQAFFDEDSLEMVKAIGAQVAIAINNAQLYELIRDQAERLGGYLRSQQMEASRQTAILEAVADGVLVTDSENKISFVNPSAEKILDIASSQIAGRSLENFTGLFGKSSQAWMQTVREWSANSASPGGEMYAEQISLDNGRVVLVHLAPVIWQNEFLGTVSIFRDITHEVEVDRLKSEFVATVSHELRTPMTSIRGYVDILMMGAAGELSQSQLHFLEIVKNNTERLNILVNDLLDISRIETGRVTLNLQPMDLREVADEVASEVLRRSQEESKPMVIVVDSEPDLPKVAVDPDRIHQIIGNLADNAYNYTPHDGKITIHIHRAGDNVQVDVEDTGVGISLEDQSRVFDRFFRGEDPLVLATPGTGLGLSIVAQLVEMHGGKIWMESSGILGEGSIFSFSLPAEKSEE